MFENAKWIMGTDDLKNDPSPDGSLYFQKSFNLKELPAEAILSCVALGYGYFFINGKAVTNDVLTTPFTKFDERVIYSVYDVTKHLKKGENIIASYVGNGWYNDTGDCWNFEKASWREVKKLICQLNITLKNGTVQTIVSDTDWSRHDAPSVYNHLREGEFYDARLEIPNWNSEKKKKWKKALIAHPPGGELCTSLIPPIRITRVLKPISKCGDVYDFGEAVSGWAKIKVQGKKGTKITLIYSEIAENGEIFPDDINMFTSSELKHTDIYIMNGEGTEEWAPSFLYHAFRYVKVSGAPESFEICAEVLHTDLKIRGSFKCSNDMLNKIHMASVRSTLYNFHSIPTDCPHREQNGWTGDALISANQSLMNFDMLEAYRKWLYDFKDVQRKSGQLPGIIPTSGWGFKWGSGPAWDSAMILIPGYVYDTDSDDSLIRIMWDNMVLYMKYFVSMSENFIADFGLGDWCPVQKEKVCPSAVTDTAYLYTDAKAMAIYARLIGKDDTEYKILAENVKRAWRKRFMNDEFLMERQTFIACGIYMKLFEDSECCEMAKKLADLVKNNNYHFDCGILGTKYIFDALSEFGYSDVLYKAVTNPEMPSYAYWILNGQTTLCENWDMHYSRFHHMYSEVDNWFYKHLGGIHIKNGSITIKPCFLNEIETVCVTHRDISVNYDEDKIEICVPSSALFIADGKEIPLHCGKNVFKRNF